MHHKPATPRPKIRFIYVIFQSINVMRSSAIGQHLQPEDSLARFFIELPRIFSGETINCHQLSSAQSGGSPKPKVGIPSPDILWPLLLRLKASGPDHTVNQGASAVGFFFHLRRQPQGNRKRVDLQPQQEGPAWEKNAGRIEYQHS